MRLTEKQRERLQSLKTNAAMYDNDIASGVIASILLDLFSGPEEVVIGDQQSPAVMGPDLRWFKKMDAIIRESTDRLIGPKEPENPSTKSVVAEAIGGRTPADIRRAALLEAAEIAERYRSTIHPSESPLYAAVVVKTDIARAIRARAEGVT